MAQAPVIASVANFLGHIEPFEKGKSEVKSYLARFEQMCIVNLIVPPYRPPDPNQDDVDDENVLRAHQEAVARYNSQLIIYELRKRGLFLTIIGDAAFRDLQKKCLPTAPADKPIAELITTFRNLFAPPLNATTAQIKFDSRVQATHESIEDFILAIQELASECNFGNHLDTALKIKLCNGIRSDRLKWEVKKEAPATYQEAVTLLKRLEPLDSDRYSDEHRVNKLVVDDQGRPTYRVPKSKHRGSSTKSNNTQGRKGNGYPNPKPPSKPPSPLKRSVEVKRRWSLPPGQCWRCGLWHDHKTCVVKDWECSQCFKKGHRQRMCLQQSINHLEIKDDIPETSEDIVIGCERLTVGKIYDVGELEGIKGNSICDYKSESENFNSSSVCDMVSLTSKEEVVLTSVADSEIVNLPEKKVDVYSGNIVVGLEEDLLSFMKENVCTKECSKAFVSSPNSDVHSSVIDVKGSHERENDLYESVIVGLENKFEVISAQVNENDLMISVSYQAEVNPMLKNDVMLNSTDIPENCVQGKESGNKSESIVISEVNVTDKDVYKVTVESCNVVKETVNSFKESKPYTVIITLDEQKLKMEVDTGSKFSIIGDKTMKKIFPDKNISDFPTKLWALSNEPLVIKGKVTFYINDKGFDLIVVEEKDYFVPLLGRMWLDELVPDWRKLFDVKCSVNAVPNFETKNIDVILKDTQTKYPNVFSEDISQSIKGIKAHIMLKPNAQLYVCKDYTLPFNLRDQTIQMLIEMERKGQIERVEYPICASPIWPILKPDGGVRVVVDFSKTINPFLMVDQYPIPKTDELLVFLSGASIFIVLDLSDAFKQLEVTDQSKDLLTINTLLGFFRFKRLIYGLACAAPLFQCAMDVILKGLENVKAYLDDVIIKSSNLKDAIITLNEVLKRFEKHNVRINFKKCQWFQPQVKYLGHLIDSSGVHTLPSKIEAIMQAPAPQDVSELRSYLGMVRYYSKFVPRLSEHLDPLHYLLQEKVQWEWSENCQKAFELSKQLMCTHTKLAHFDVKKQIVLICDASPKGISAVLAHRINRQDIPVACASYTLTSAQKSYSQLHREALAIVVGVTKFHKYLYGTSFILITDNAAIAAIFNPAKGLPVFAHDRLIRYGVILSAHRFTIERRPSTEMGPADALSRLPVKNTAVEFVNALTAKREIPINAEIIIAEQLNDPILVQIRQFLTTEWPNNASIEFREFFKVKDALVIEENCLMMGQRIVIPESLRADILNLIHKGHPGIVRSKMIARSEIWWPKVDQAIEEVCRQCLACSQINFKPTKVFVPWPDTGKPWTRIHLDFFQFQDQKFLILVDSFSKWIDIHPCGSRTRFVDIEPFLKTIFATFGNPLLICTDNGPPFQGEEFANFCTDRNIVLLHSPPYNPRSNGLAERGVKTAKEGLKKILLDTKDNRCIQNSIVQFLATYRNTPSTATNVSPASVLFKFKPRNELRILNPKVYNFKHTNVPEFFPGEKVRYKANKNEEVKEGLIDKILGKTTYIVNIQDKPFLASVNQLNKCYTAESFQENAKQPDYQSMYAQLSTQRFQTIRDPDPAPIASPTFPVLANVPDHIPANTETAPEPGSPEIDSNSEAITAEPAEIEVDQNIEPRRSSRVRKPPGYILENYVLP